MSIDFAPVDAGTSTGDLPPGGGTTTDLAPTARRWWATAPWATAVPLGILLAFADGFVMLALRGAVGSIERAQGPFVMLLVESGRMVPLYVLLAVGVVHWARLWFGSPVRGLRGVLGTALALALAATVLGIAWTATSSALDYRLQLHEIDVQAISHSHISGGIAGAQAATRHALVVGNLLAAPVTLVANLVLTLWVVAMRGGRVDTERALPAED